jgi:transcriptional regulator with XRE-family HTH domain
MARLIDAHVGRRVRERRTDLAISRSELARLLGISAEQLRRCEAGLASLVASRLHEIGAALAVPASYFFEGLPKDGTKLKATTQPQGRASPTTRELGQLVDAY